jgi:hypothetical protein
MPMPFLIALLLQSQIPQLREAPPPPVPSVRHTSPPVRTVRVPTPPPVPIPAPVETAERYLLDVEALGGGDLLWSGQLRVAANVSATVRRELTQASEQPCPESGYIGNTEQASLNLSFQPRPVSQGDHRLQVSARWARPGDNSCSSGLSARVAELTDLLTLEPDVWTEIRGDAGLVLRVRRRR